MRKHLLLVITTFLFSFIASAQIGKGSVLLGGNLSAFTNKYASSGATSHLNQSGFSASPSIGIAFKENAVWGISLGYSHSWYKSDAPTFGDNKGSGYSGGIYHRRYITLGKGFYLFGQANAGFNRHKSKESTTPDYGKELKGWAVNFSAYPGITYAINKRMHLEVGISELISFGYGEHEQLTTTQNQKYSTTQKNVSFGTNLSTANPLSIGFRFVLGK